MVISKINQKSLYIIYSILFISILSLILVKSTYADESSNLNYSITVEPALNITTSPNKVSLDLNPLNHGFDSRDLTVSVSTNNETGYKLYVNTTTTNLVENNDPNLIIKTLENEVVDDADSFILNRWGYRIGSGNYLPFESGILLNSSKTQTENNSSTLTFAAKVGYETKAGTYNLALNFQATANPHIPYMQNLDPTLCVTDEPTTVIDARDEKFYTIQRLKDDKCWMTTNLNLAGGTKLYSETSNVPDGYPESAGVGYYTLPDSSSTGFTDDSTDYVYNTGNETTSQADCTDTKPCNSYYSWLASTAGGKDANGNMVTGNGYNAAYSVCPKGWRLPTTTTSNTNPTMNGNWKTGDLYKLTTAYGANLEDSSSDESSSTGGNFYKNAGPGTAANFLLAGFYHSGRNGSGGVGGSYRSSTSSSDVNAYNLALRSDLTYLANSGYRATGLPVRCLLAE